MERNVVKKSTSYLTFKMNNETFAANVANVQIILEVSEITKMPKTPDYVLGVIDFRGSVLPLIDLRIKFGLEKWENSVNTCVLVLEIKNNNSFVKLGILVDNVEEVIDFIPDQVQAPPEMGNRYINEILEGIYKYNNNFIMILNINKLFSINELGIVNVMADQISSIE